MDFKSLGLEKIILILLVLAVSSFVGWYGERAVEKFIANNNNSVPSVSL